MKLLNSKGGIFMEVVSALAAILALAFVVEFLTNIIKGLIQVEAIGKVKLTPIISMVVGIAVAILCKADIMAAIGFPIQYQLGAWIITGLIISGGSALVYEFISKIRESRTSVQMSMVNQAKLASLEAETKMPTLGDVEGPSQ
jgi:hypothetical protein